MTDRFTLDEEDVSLSKSRSRALTGSFENGREKRDE